VATERGIYDGDNTEIQLSIVRCTPTILDSLRNFYPVYLRPIRVFPYALPRRANQRLAMLPDARLSPWTIDEVTSEWQISASANDRTC